MYEFPGEGRKAGVHVPPLKPPRRAHLSMHQILDDLLIRQKPSANSSPYFFKFFWTEFFLSKKRDNRVFFQK